MSKFRIGTIGNNFVSQGRYLNIFFSFTTDVGLAKVISSYFYWVNLKYSRKKPDALQNITSLQLDEVILKSQIKKFFTQEEIKNIEYIDNVKQVIKNNNNSNTQITFGPFDNE